MKSLVIKKSNLEQRLDKVILNIFSNLSFSVLSKAFRKKDIKVNKKWVNKDYVLKLNDLVEIYIADKYFEHKEITTKPFELDIVFEDNNILVINKSQGLAVHPDKNEEAHTLIKIVTDYLILKKEYNIKDSTSFPPSLCHRLDRNTSGLIIVAKNEKSLNSILLSLRNRTIKKYYLCIVKGKVLKDSNTLHDFLVKDKKNSQVFISDKNTKKSVSITTTYNRISTNETLSLLEVQLITGRTHQIRAHLAYIGHPILGDGKYGINTFNKSFKCLKQSLCAYKIVFSFDPLDYLSYLNDKTFETSPHFNIKHYNL